MEEVFIMTITKSGNLFTLILGETEKNEFLNKMEGVRVTSKYSESSKRHIYVF